MEVSLAEVHKAIVRSVPEREALIHARRRWSHAEIADRSRRLASYLRRCRLRVHVEREELQPHESGQDHVALYLHNSNEYLESLVGSWYARAAPFNVNYRYTGRELAHLLSDSRARAIVYHATFAPTLQAIREQVSTLEALIQVADGSGNALLPGAVDYEEALALSEAAASDPAPSPDDLFVLYTGGTTGSPKGVLWRGTDVFYAAMGGVRPDGSEVEDLAVFAQELTQMEPTRTLIAPPFMHAAALWAAFQTWMNGGTVVLPDDTTRLDAPALLRVIETERCSSLLIVGDAFARPILDALESSDHDLSCLAAVISSGAALAPAKKAALLEALPHVMLVDGIGSSESGPQGVQISTRAGTAASGTFRPLDGAAVVSSDRTRLLEPGSDEVGWFARSGRVPLGYLGDAEKTRATFPEIDGRRWAVPGDRARIGADGTIELLGRDSTTINSGGEKIFAEEVEEILRSHPDIADALVTGRPSDRWGEEVVGIVALRDGHELSMEALLAFASDQLARYKLPKAILFRDHIERSPAGKGDYRWAAEQAAD